jgi:hypothetical protein
VRGRLSSLSRHERQPFPSEHSAMMRAALVLVLPVLLAEAFSPQSPCAVRCAPTLAVSARSFRAYALRMLGEGEQREGKGGKSWGERRRHLLGRTVGAAAAAAMGLPWASSAFDVEKFTEQVRKREQLLQQLEKEKAIPGGHSERVQAWLRRQSGSFPVRKSKGGAGGGLVHLRCMPHTDQRPPGDASMRSRRGVVNSLPRSAMCVLDTLHAIQSPTRT